MQYSVRAFSNVYTLSPLKCCKRHKEQPSTTDPGLRTRWYLPYLPLARATTAGYSNAPATR